jgi:hypothetical protein
MQLVVIPSSACREEDGQGKPNPDQSNSSQDVKPIEKTKVTLHPRVVCQAPSNFFTSEGAIKDV